MAIYAFDGTTCTPGDLSNVFKMYDAYISTHKFYATGPGSRGTKFSKFLETVTGHGGKDRIHDAVGIWKYWQSRGSRETIIIGFSRGAVIAREFANRVNDEGGIVDFLGIYDSVGSFGNPFNTIDKGYRKKIPNSVKLCAHVLSIDETRFTFRVLRAKPSEGSNAKIEECWFKGVHSDVGGTLKEGLGAASLTWMFDRSTESGIKQWDASAIAEARTKANCDEEPSANKISLPKWFLSHLRTRKIKPDDTICCQ